jgi:hypothetical protein
MHMWWAIDDGRDTSKSAQQGADPAQHMWWAVSHIHSKRAAQQQAHYVHASSCVQHNTIQAQGRSLRKQTPNSELLGTPACTTTTRQFLLLCAASPVLDLRTPPSTGYYWPGHPGSLQTLYCAMG